MNLPDSELFPEDPEQLPPARRRRARRLLAPLDMDERTSFLSSLTRRTTPSFDFFLFSLLAGAVIALGLILDLPAILLLGVLLAPSMAPLVGVSLAAVVGSGPFFVRSLGGFVVGSLMVFLASGVAGLVVPIGEPLPLTQANAHALLSWPDLALLALGTVLTTLTLARTERSTPVASVAIAYELYLPLAAAGFGLTSGVPFLWPDGLVVYAFHLAVAALFGALTLVILGFRPLTLFGYTLSGAVALMSVIVVVALSGAGAMFGAQVALPTQTPTLTHTLTPVPPTITPSLTPVPPTVTVTPSLTPTRTNTPTVTPTITPTPVYGRVNNDDGAWIREDPSFRARGLLLMEEGRLLQIFPKVEVVDGYTWVLVQDVETGTIGWVYERLINVATPVPNW